MSSEVEPGAYERAHSRSVIRRTCTRGRSARPRRYRRRGSLESGFMETSFGVEQFLINEPACRWRNGMPDANFAGPNH
jgi:hypothetical protein